MVPYFGGRLTFQVIGIIPPADVVLVTSKTSFTIAEKDAALWGMPHVSYEDIGGLSNEMQKVHEMIDLPLRHPTLKNWELKLQKECIYSTRRVLGKPCLQRRLLVKATPTLSASAGQVHITGI
jgi:hypothetical protein